MPGKTIAEILFQWIQVSILCWITVFSYNSNKFLLPLWQAEKEPIWRTELMLAGAKLQKNQDEAYPHPVSIIINIININNTNCLSPLNICFHFWIKFSIKIINRECSAHSHGQYTFSKKTLFVWNSWLSIISRPNVCCY